MKLKDALQSLDYTKAIEIAKQCALELGLSWDKGVKHAFAAILRDKTRVPDNIKGIDESETIKKWLRKYKKGYEDRASKRASKAPGTVADPIIEALIHARLNGLSTNELTQITYAHRLAMAAENILGLILEEYLSIELVDAGWYCAWGATVKDVDFINEDGRLLQIKNRSNSENSASSSVRDGTDIEKWFRVQASRIEYKWAELNVICGTKDLSEESFVKFAKEVLATNPQCLAIEDENPWKPEP